MWWAQRSWEAHSGICTFVPVLGCAMSVSQADAHLQRRGEILLGGVVVAHSFNISMWEFQNWFQGYS